MPAAIRKGTMMKKRIKLLLLFTTVLAIALPAVPALATESCVWGGGITTTSLAGECTYVNGRSGTTIVYDTVGRFRGIPDRGFYGDINIRLWIDRLSGTDTYVWGYLQHVSCWDDNLVCASTDFGEAGTYPNNTKMCTATYRLNSNGTRDRITGWACVNLHN